MPPTAQFYPDVLSVQAESTCGAAPATSMRVPTKKQNVKDKKVKVIQVK